VEPGVLSTLNQFDVWNAVPLDGSATYAEISARTGLGAAAAQRLLQHAMTRRVFAETSPGSGRVAHTAASALAARDALLRAWMGHNLEEVAVAAPRLPDALRRWAGVPEPEDPARCAARVALFPDLPDGATAWDFFAADDDEGRKAKGWRIARFGDAMHCIAESPGFNVDSVCDMIDWEGMGEATVVDVSPLPQPREPLFRSPAGAPQS
jgi:hypothetical protein